MHKIFIINTRYHFLVSKRFIDSFNIQNAFFLDVHHNIYENVNVLNKNLYLSHNKNESNFKKFTKYLKESRSIYNLKNILECFIKNNSKTIIYFAHTLNCIENYIFNRYRYKDNIKFGLIQDGVLNNNINIFPWQMYLNTYLYKSILMLQFFNVKYNSQKYLFKNKIVCFGKTFNQNTITLPKINNKIKNNSVIFAASDVPKFLNVEEWIKVNIGTIKWLKNKYDDVWVKLHPLDTVLMNQKVKNCHYYGTSIITLEELIIKNGFKYLYTINSSCGFMINDILLNCPEIKILIPQCFNNKDKNILINRSKLYNCDYQLIDI
jgi:hypothetical protein